MKRGTPVWIGRYTILSIVIGVLFTAVSFYLDMGDATAMILAALAANLTVIVALHEAQIREIQSMREAVASRATIETLPNQIHHPWVKILAEFLLGRATHALESLIKPTREFDNEPDYYRAVTDECRQLGNGDQAIAVCTDTPTRWHSKPIGRYLSENAAAARRGASFSRIILARQPAVLDFAQRQANDGIRVLYLKGAAIEQLTTTNRIPEDMGVLVVNSHRVYLHWIANHGWYGCMVESTVLATILLSVVNNLESQADIVRPESHQPTAA